MKFEGYDIIEYDQRYAQELAELLVPLCGPSVELNKAYLDWKFYRNPYVNRPSIHLALWEGHPVGVHAFYVTCWQIGDPSQCFLCLSDADGFVHPDHRRRGILKHLASVAHAGLVRDSYEYIIELSGASPYSVAVNLGLGYRSAGNTKTMEWKTRQLTDSEGKVRSAVRKIPFLPETYRALRKLVRKPAEVSVDDPGFGTLDRSLARLKWSEKYRVVEGKEPRCEAMATMVAKHCEKDRLGQMRDQRFFSWRYQNPLSVYRFLFWEKDGLEGYVVLRKSAQWNSNSVDIVDWEAYRLEILSGLLQAAIDHGGFDSLRIWSTSLSAEAQEILRKLGFSDLETERGAFTQTILVKPVRESATAEPWLIGERDLLDTTTWDLRGIYSDAY
jgi:hypothetical protein